MSIVGTGAVGLRKLSQSGTHYRLASEAMVNELERLTALPQDQVVEAVTRVQLPESVESRLTNAQIEAVFADDSHGERIVLSLNWSRPGAPKPLTMVGWLKHRKPSPASEMQAEQTSPSDDESAVDQLETPAQLGKEEDPS